MVKRAAKTTSRGRGRPRMNPAQVKGKWLQVRVSEDFLERLKTAAEAEKFSGGVSDLARTLLEEWLKKKERRGG